MVVEVGVAVVLEVGGVLDDDQAVETLLLAPERELGWFREKREGISELSAGITVRSTLHNYKKLKAIHSNFCQELLFNANCKIFSFHPNFLRLQWTVWVLIESNPGWEVTSTHCWAGGGLSMQSLDVSEEHWIQERQLTEQHDTDISGTRHCLH